MSHIRTPRASLIAVLSLACAAAIAAKPQYDPLRVTSDQKIETLDRVVDDQSRQRQIPLRIYLPAGRAAAPVVLFSHGLGGSRENNPYLGNHWAARGYAVVFLQHPGSDADVWRDVPQEQRRAALREAADLQNFMLRVRDVPAVLDQLGKWNATRTNALAGRLDLEHVGMSGHSFGAITTQAVSGQQFLGGRRSFTDPRIKAAIMMSPNAPRRGDASAAFGSVQLPWLLMTGTNDTAIIGDATVESRRGVFPALPAGGKYELVLDKAEHSAFSDRALPGDQQPRNPNHHRAILALSTAFWDANLRNDAAARDWLDGAGPRAVLEPEDRWQRK